MASVIMLSSVNLFKVLLAYLYLHFLFVKCGRYQPVRFFFIRFGYIPCGYTFFAVGAKQSPVEKGKIQTALDNSVIIHFYKITFADFLVMGDEAFAISAANLQNMAAPDFFAIRIFINFHRLSLVLS